MENIKQLGWKVIFVLKVKQATEMEGYSMFYSDNVA